jgi:hemerythrin-like metal-binding protein
VDFVLQSAQLHDVGKIAIPDAILNKPARLTADEFETMKTHVTVGIDAVNRIVTKTKEQLFLRHALHIVGAHHEKWDGTGYPYGIKEDSIPLEGRLMAVADVYDALVSWRPYKDKLTHEQAKKIIVESRGTHFDPVLVDVFLEKEDMFRQISSKDTLNEIAERNLIALTKDMLIGVDKIDAQHKELIDRLNHLVSLRTESVSDDEIKKMLDFLSDYAVKHFADEEALQIQSGYPKYEWHKKQHQLFVDEYRKMRQEFDCNGFSAEFVSKLKDSVISWIVNHIKSVDVEFGKYYQLRVPLGVSDAPRGRNGDVACWDAV